MGRIRTVKPEWLEDERLAACSDAARVLSIALITLADDHGNGRGSEIFLASRVWPYSDDLAGTSKKLAASCGELSQAGYVEFYTVDNQRYFHIRNWSRHQRISNAGKPRVPGPPQVAASCGVSRLDHDHDQEEERDAREDSGLQPVPTVAELLEREHERRYTSKRTVTPTKNRAYREQLAAAAAWCDAQASASGQPVTEVIDRLLKGLFESANPRVDGDWGMRFLATDCAEFYAPPGGGESFEARRAAEVERDH